MMAMDLATARHRIAVRQQVQTCRACPLVDHATPVPFSGPTPPRFVVLGEAPGQVENRHREPFVGPAGRLLRRLLRAADLSDHDGLFVNPVSCCSWGTPTQKHMDACRGNLVAQLELGDARPILAAGQTAVRALFPDGHVRRLHGRVLDAQIDAGPFRASLRHLVMPIYHPAFILRDPSNKTVVMEALRNFRLFLDGVLPPDFLQGDWCSQCEHKAVAWDDRLMPYCQRHQKQIKGNARREKRRRKAERKAAQGRLL